MRTPIGRQRFIVTLEAPGPPQPDGEGGYTEGWLPLAPPTWRVDIRPASVRDLERDTAGTVLAHATHIVAGRYRPDVTTAVRIKWDDYAKDGTHRTRYLQVNGLANLEERDRELVLFCEEQITPATASSSTPLTAPIGFSPTANGTA